MENFNSIISLLGADNEKRLKDGITDLLLRQIERDLADRYEYEYIIAFDSLFEEAKEKIEEEFKEKAAQKYKEYIDNKLKAMFKD